MWWSVVMMIIHVNLYFLSPMLVHDLGYIDDASFMWMRMLELGVYKVEVIEFYWLLVTLV